MNLLAFVIVKQRSHETHLPLFLFFSKVVITVAVFMNLVDSGPALSLVK